MRLPACRFPGCREFGGPVTLPFSDRVLLLCHRHRPWAVLVRLRELVA